MLTRAGRELPLSRERVRQLVKEAQAFEAAKGRPVLLRRALEIVLEARDVEPERVFPVDPRTARTRPKPDESLPKPPIFPRHPRGQH